MAKRDLCDWWVGEELMSESNQGGGVELAVDSEAHDPTKWFGIPRLGLMAAVDDRVDIDAYAVGIHGRI